MKYIMVIWALLACLPVKARYGWHVGVITGEPVGLSMSREVDGNGAYDFALGWDLSDGGFVHMHGDRVWYYRLILDKNQALPVYAGAGVRLRLGRKAGISARAPLGTRYVFRPHPFEAFLEIVPTLTLVPATALDLKWALGVRYIWP
ncbi:MAG: hypothetical protein D6677_08995 [Calditrichaeota bacterium]|nr:MAG: hypothetical protein D6677_08995 [Calditrichota bacterium]